MGPGNPPTDAEMTEKYHGLTDPVIGHSDAASLHELIWSMGEGLGRGACRQAFIQLSQQVKVELREHRRV